MGRGYLDLFESVFGCGFGRKLGLIFDKVTEKNWKR